MLGGHLPPMSGWAPRACRGFEQGGPFPLRWLLPGRAPGGHRWGPPRLPPACCSDRRWAHPRRTGLSADAALRSAYGSGSTGDKCRPQCRPTQRGLLSALGSTVKAALPPRCSVLSLSCHLGCSLTHKRTGSVRSPVARSHAILSAQQPRQVGPAPVPLGDTRSLLSSVSGPHSLHFPVK